MRRKPTRKTSNRARSSLWIDSKPSEKIKMPIRDRSCSCIKLSSASKSQTESERPADKPRVRIRPSLKIRILQFGRGDALLKSARGGPKSSRAAPQSRYRRIVADESNRRRMNLADIGRFVKKLKISSRAARTRLRMKI